MKSTSVPSNELTTQTGGEPAETITRTEATAAAHIPPDRRFAQFELVEILGSGGMGVVWKARDLQLQRVVALKMLLAGAASHPVQIQRFETEAQAIARLEHQNIVPVLEFKSFHGQPYFTMPLITGGKLADLKERYRNDVRATVALVEKLARAVAYAHERNVVHRDLKPSNILIDDDGEPRIADFGLAKLLDEQTELTVTGTIVGTPAYMSPEQAAGKQTIGPPCDIWALGVILFELLGGARPFPGSSREEVTPRILNDDCRAVEVWPIVEGTGVGGIILKCLQKLPADRYPSAMALADDLANYLAGREVTAKAPAPRKLSRRRMLTLSVGTATVLGMGGFALYRSLSQSRLPLMSLRRELESKGSCELLNADGSLRWHALIHGEAQIGTPPGEPQLSVLSKSALIELLPDNPYSNLILEAEFRFDPIVAAQSSGVSLYQGRLRDRTSNGIQVECYVRFGAFETRPAGEASEFQHGKFASEVTWNGVTESWMSSSILPAEANYRYATAGQKWHHLKMQMAATGLVFEADEMRTQIDRNQLAAAVAARNPKYVPDVSSFVVRLQAGQGLGIGISNARAWFRAIRLSVVRS